jgi:hypothetical protein
VPEEVKELLDEQLTLVKQIRDENDKGAKANAEALDNMNKRLDAIELQLKRIGRTSVNDNTPEQDSPEQKAYVAYLRTGEIDTKSLTTGDSTQAGMFATLAR